MSVAIVTGAAGGIGRATCRRLARDGWHIGALDVDSDGARSAAALALAEGARAAHAQCDITDPTSIETAKAVLRLELGPVTALVNNAGILGPAGQKVAELDDQAWQQVLDVNLTGARLATKSFLPDLVACQSGRVVNVCSGAAIIGVPGLGAYAASKAALLSLTKTLALELAAEGVRVTAICPGNIDTDMLSELTRSMTEAGDPDPRETLTRYHAIDRLGSPDDVAGAIAFLLSADADFVTGSPILVDGGALAGSSPRVAPTAT